MKDYKGYLIDLDGTMYNGTEKIEEACEFVRQFFPDAEAGGGQADEL